MINSNLANDLYLVNSGNFALTSSDSGGIDIPANSYAYIKFPDYSTSCVSFSNTYGSITFKKTGFYIINLTLNIYSLDPSETIIFGWQTSITQRRVMHGAIGATYTKYSFTEVRYYSSPNIQELPILWNIQSRAIQYAFCNIMVMHMP